MINVSVNYNYTWYYYYINTYWIKIELSIITDIDNIEQYSKEYIKNWQI